MKQKLKAVLVAVGIGLASVQAQAVELYGKADFMPKASILQQTKSKVAGFYQSSKKTLIATAAGVSTALITAQVHAASLMPEGVEGTLLADVKDTIADVIAPMFPIMTAVAISMAALSWWGRGLGKAKVR